MKEIIKALVDEKNIRVIIDGSNIDLLKAVSLILKMMETDIPRETSLEVINNMLEGD